MIAMRRLLVVLIFGTLRTAVLAADDCKPPASCAAHAVGREVVRYARDAKSMAAAPLHWDRAAWTRFGEGLAVVGALYAMDQEAIDRVQDNRTSFSDDFAKTITPLGGHRSLEISVLLIAAGAGMHRGNVRDAGRDALESELIAAGVVTPLLKRVFGRARPIQNEGRDSFHPFDKNYESFPSGHATSAFAVATAVAGHYDGWVVPTIAYTLASGVAASRVNDFVHFPSDVVAGALIGHAVARGVVARHNGRHVAWHAVPYFDGRTGGFVLTIDRMR